MLPWIHPVYTLDTDTPCIHTGQTPHVWHIKPPGTYSDTLRQMCMPSVACGCICGCICGRIWCIRHVARGVSGGTHWIHPRYTLDTHGPGSKQSWGSGCIRCLSQVYPGYRYTGCTQDTPQIHPWIHPRYTSHTPQIHPGYTWARGPTVCPMATSPL